jgi:hypothetical protein
MHRILLACSVLAVSVALAPFVAAAPAAPTAGHAAHAATPAAPKQIGKFDDWQAATYVEGGQTVCYALTRARSSSPALAGRGAVVLTVTQRPNLRDVVAFSAGFAYAKDATAAVEAGTAKFDFYTAQRSAFAREGAAAVAAFDKAARAVVRSPGPKGGQVTDNFSLRGFSAAYAAINKACPAK